MSKIIKLAGIIGCSFCAGVLIGGSTKSLGRVLAVGSLISLPTCYGVHLLVDDKANKRVSKAERKASECAANLDKANARLATIQEENSQLVTNLATVRAALAKSESDRSQLSTLTATLTPAVAKLEADLKTAAAQIEYLQAECQEWEAQFSTRVETEAESRFQKAKREEIERIFQEHDAITGEAMRLFRQLQQWGQKVAEGHDGKKQLIRSLAQSYNQNLDEINQAVSTEREQYLLQIEALHEKVGALQHQLAGDLTEPEYLQCGFDPSGKVGNAIAEWLWNHHKIPLKVTGFEVGSDGITTVGYTYPRSVPVEALIRTIEDDSPVMARNLGLYAIEKPQKLQVTDCLTCKVRRERPARKADKGSLYRSSQELIKYILSQPVRLRMIGEPGAGKTPTVAVLLSHVLKRGFLEANTPNGRKLPHCIVESCNPLAGISVKNGDELDFCLKWDSGATGFKGLVQEYRFRKNPANADYKNQVGYIWVADEIDNSMADLTKDEAKPFKDSLKDGGHVNLGVIVMGQSANVSTSKGLSIDDQKMMTNLYIDPVSIRTFLTQYGERFYSKRAVEKALSTLEELELEIEERNEVICDTAREFRIAMVTANRSPVFYQLPYFDSVDIDLQAYQETLEIVKGIRERRGETRSDASVFDDSQDVYTVTLSERLDGSRRSPYAGLETGRDTSVKPVCPYCGSDKVRSKGDSWLCQSSDHYLKASGKPKSWKK